MSPRTIVRALARPLPGSWRRGLKRALAAVVDRAGRWSSRRVAIGLCYHRVSDPPGEKARELVPALGTLEFEAQVRHLAGRYRLVRASQLRDAANRRRRGERLPLAITFDDDLPTHLREAAPILERNRAPATFFVNGASLDASHEFWFERLQRGWDEGTVTAAALAEREIVGAPGAISPIRGFATAIQALAPERRALLATELAELAGPDRPESGMRAADVRELVERGFEVGFHTLRHDALPELGDEELTRAMTDGSAELEAAAGAPLRTISYPHGEADERVAGAARAAGFEHGFTALGRAVDGGDDPLLLDRVYPSPGSPADFELDLALRLWRAGR